MNFAALAAFGMLGGVASAADFSPFVRSGFVFSDNVARAVSKPDSAAVAGFELGGTLKVDTQSNYVFLRASATGYKFASAPAEYRDETLGKVDADWMLGLVPETLSWVTSETYGQVAGRSYEQIQPGNREDVNVLATGPQLDLAMGSKTAVGASLRYLNTDYSRTALDNHGYSGALSASWKATDLQTYSLHAEQERTDFGSTSIASDSLRRVFARWESRSRHSELLLQAGTARLESGSRKRDEPTYLASLSTGAGAYSTAQVLVARSFEGASARVRLGSLSGTRFVDPGSDTLLAADQAIVDRWLVNWTTQKPRSTLRLSAFMTKYRYGDSQQLDRTLSGASVLALRRVAQGTDLSAHVEYDRDRAAQSGAVATLFNPGLQVSRTLSRKVAAVLAVDYFRQVTTQRVGEWRTTFTLQYPAGIQASQLMQPDDVAHRIQQEGTEFARRPQPARR